MKQLPWLPEDAPEFPGIEEALEDPNGLLAAGGALTVPWLLAAYRRGIFPWYEKDQPILWWSPDPRCVINPAAFVPSRSLAKRIRRNDYEIRVDTAFPAVIDACSHRHDREDTWITPEMKRAYIALNEQGFAHSIECFMDDALVGGLYGVSIGNLFFGESMFHQVTDASKLAFSGLMRLMNQHHSAMVDCQIPNPHLMSLGAFEVPRKVFKQTLQAGLAAPEINWAALHGRLDL